MSDTSRLAAGEGGAEDAVVPLYLIENPGESLEIIASMLDEVQNLVAPLC